jgi:hypothetical protein
MSTRNQSTFFSLSEWSPYRIRPEVTWRPPQIHLHYNELYIGIYEYLRAPPNRRHEAAALVYLADIQQSNHYPLSANVHYIQNHRILWIREWLKALPFDAGECSDAETVVHEYQEEAW